MTLESLLKPVKWADEQVLRGYTKIAKRWEDRGKNIYHLSSAIGMPAKFLIFWGCDEVIGKGIGLPIELSLYNWDFAYNLSGLMNHSKEKGDSDGTRVVNPGFELYKRINKIERLPTLAAGLYLTGKSLYEIVSHFATGEPLQQDTLHALILGAGFLSISSSQYLKDRNPKLLEKKPFWKQAYDLLKDKIGQFAPAPRPVPQQVPVRTYTTIDEAVLPQ